jgi:hypothetical protein
MQKTTLALLAGALITASAVQPVTAAQSHRSHWVHRVPVVKNWRDSNAYVPLVAQPQPYQFDEALAPPAGH